MAEDKKRLGEGRSELFREMEELMRNFEKRMPIEMPTVIYPRYYKKEFAEPMAENSMGGTKL